MKFISGEISVSCLDLWSLGPRGRSLGWLRDASVATGLRGQRLGLV